MTDRLLPRDYFLVAMDILATDGPGGLTVAALCERLGVTRGSFYHHFGGTPTFVAGLLHYWEREHSKSEIALVDAINDPAGRLSLIRDNAVRLPHQTESALRSWSRSNDVVQAVLQRVDKRREVIMRETCTAAGHDAERAALLARVVMDMFIGAQQRPLEDQSDLPPMLDAVLGWILASAPESTIEMTGHGSREDVQRARCPVPVGEQGCPVL